MNEIKNYRGKDIDINNMNLEELKDILKMIIGFIGHEESRINELQERVLQLEFK